MSEYVLVFGCCGNEVPIGRTRQTGAHGQHCLSCDTASPPTEVRER